mgnify:CR=1 FL=1
MAKYDYIIYTDGSCHGNPGVGGYAAVILDRTNGETVVSGGDYYTTNNKMELTAVVKALHEIVKSGKTRETRRLNVLIVTDSRYVANQINRNDLVEYVKPKKRKNRDLWGAMLTLSIFFNLEAEWIKGHAGDPINERCDKRANKEAWIVKHEEDDRLVIFKEILLNGPQIRPEHIFYKYGNISLDTAKKYIDLYNYHRFTEEN